ncbi:MAG: Holliday junction branch migration protein RuvA [Candidatus Zeuxoniibacter abyssi]|nr:MAG: Holliday junction branch migration protein RuvA [Candidatus Persebacteraceae bacterium AB1(2)]
MIASLNGYMAAKSAASVVLEINGIGYEVAIPLTVMDKLPTIGEKVFLLIEFVVREESQTLYGFLDETTRALFRRLIKISGIGAKTALAMMSTMTAKELLSALANEDHARLSGTPGIGKKTAERLIIEFRGNALLSSSGADFGVIRDDDVEQALTSLGYKKAEIKRALTAMPPDATDTAVKVRAALRFLAGK